MDARWLTWCPAVTVHSLCWAANHVGQPWSILKTRDAYLVAERSTEFHEVIADLTGNTHIERDRQESVEVLRLHGLLTDWP